LHAACPDAYGGAAVGPRCAGALRPAVDVCTPCRRDPERRRRDAFATDPTEQVLRSVECDAAPRLRPGQACAATVKRDCAAYVPHLFLTAQFTNRILHRMSHASQQYQPDPVETLFHRAYYQLIHTLCSLLPPPLDDTPEAMLARNDAAIAKVAALLPVNADEADIAAHCVAARAQAEDVMRSLRNHASDIHLSMKLNAQYCLMERTAVSVRTQLLRVQTARHKREKDPTACDQDGWSEHIAEQLMTRALGDAPPRPAAAPPPREIVAAATLDPLPRQRRATLSLLPSP